MLISRRTQLWSTYALHFATFTTLSVAFDPFILWACHRATQNLPGQGHFYCMLAQVLFMAWIKVIKLVGLFRRNPIDVVYLPVSILFGYFHSFIKIYALLTWNTVSGEPTSPLSAISNNTQTSWGSREDGDANDAERMSPRGRRSESITMPPGNHPGLIRYNDEKSLMRSSSADPRAFFPFDEKATITTTEMAIDSDDDTGSDSDSDLLDSRASESDYSDDCPHDCPNDFSDFTSMVMKAHGR